MNMVACMSEFMNKTTPKSLKLPSINDADKFALELEYAMQKGFFQGGDVLVLDDTAVHTARDIVLLQDCLWEDYDIFSLLLPAALLASAKIILFSGVEIVPLCKSQK